jgi:Ca2+-transporting ATPase
MTLESLDRPSPATADPVVPWMIEGAAVAAGLHTSVLTGLPAEEAAARLARYGPNTITIERPPSLARSVGRQLRDTMIMVLLAAGVITVLTGDYADAAVILLVVLVNTTVGVVQERRALGAVQALRSMAAPVATVRRDGARHQVASADVVPGDLLVLAEGDVVAADARLLEEQELEVDESLLTGESLPVSRAVVPLAAADTPTADRRCMVHGGTLVVHGHGLAVVVGTGRNSVIGGVSTLLAEASSPVTPLQRRLDRLGRVLSAIAVGGCLVVGLLGLAQGQPWELVLVTAVSLAVAAIPESLPAVVALSLAAGAHRMARHGAIVRTLGAVETLGSVTVLATDKTGTLTTGAMEVVANWIPPVDGEPADPDLVAVLAGAGPGPAALLAAGALCNDADRDGEIGGLTEVALVRAARRAGIDVWSLRADLPRIAEVPFNRTRRDMSTTHQGPAGAFMITKGAPEAVLRSLDPGSAPEMTLAQRAADEWAGQGRRVLAITVTGDGEPARLLGLLAIADPVRPEATAAVKACREAGITPVLITGDHPGTARAVAAETGLEGPVLGGAGEVGDRIHARAEPVTKVRLVTAWQRDGQVVAMTGDGVNDAPALRAADIGVAMGLRGTDVARGAADLVLTDDSLATIVTAVAEGRRVFDNIRRFVRYGLSGGAAEIAVMLIGPLLGFPLPLLAGQILWINLVTHGLPGVAIGAEQAEPDVLKRAPRRPSQPILTRPLVVQILILALALTGSSLAAALWVRSAGGAWQSVLFAVLALGQLGLALTTRSDVRYFWRVPLRGNRMLGWAVVGSAALILLALYLPPLQTVLRTQGLGVTELLAVGIGACGPAVAAQVLVARRRRRNSPRDQGPGGSDLKPLSRSGGLRWAGNDIRTHWRNRDDEPDPADPGWSRCAAE